MASPQVYLAPCSKQGGDSRAYRHLLDTVVGGVNLDNCDTSTKVSGEMAVWGLTDGNKSRWDAIEKGDYFLFYVGEERYEYAAQVVDKEANHELAIELWPDYQAGETGGDDPGDPWDYIVYLDFPDRINVDSQEIHNPAGHERNFTQRFMRLNDQGREHLIDKYGGIEEFVSAVAIEKQWRGSDGGGSDSGSGASASTSPDRDEQSVDLRPPKYTDVQVSRVVRNTTLAKEIKELYDHRCQVYGEQRMKGPGEPYAEAHHVRPLGGSPPGPDVEENIIVLCPDHHADFDYGMVEIEPNTLQITHAYDQSLTGTKLRVESRHNLATNFFEFHNEQISKL